MNKKIQIVNLLRNRIIHDEFPEGKLPREIDLCTEFAVGRVTVRAALADLEREDLIVRKKHIGTFIKVRTSVGKSNHTGIGVIMRTQGHVYGDLYHFLIQQLMVRGISADVISTSPIDLEYAKSGKNSLKKSIERLLDGDCYGLLVDGYCNTNLPHIEKILKESPVFFDYFDAGHIAMPSYGVWINYEKAGYLAGKYLMEQGCRHPLLVGNYLSLQVRFYPEGYQRHRETQIIRGYRAALSEYGLDSDSFVLGSNYNSLEEGEDILKSIIRDRHVRPDGILFASDAMALKPIRLISHLGIRMPDEIRLVGIGNTPWSNEASLCPFASVDLQLEKLAEALIDMVLQKPANRIHTYIEPILVTRENEKLN